MEVEKIKLPIPNLLGSMTVEKAIQQRKSNREFTNSPISLREFSQLIWAAQGITREKFYRTIPSAGALYPLNFYIAVGNVNDLKSGIYSYYPQGHALLKIIDGDRRHSLATAADQLWLEKSSVVIVISAIYNTTTTSYGERGIRYVHMEVGHASQNISIQAVALNLGTVVVGEFDDQEVKYILRLHNNEYPLCLMPVGTI